VLHVGVHDGDVVSGGGEHAFDAGGGEAAATYAVDEADAAVAVGVLADEFSGVVGRVVVDEEELPGEAFEGGLEAVDELRDVATLVVGGDDDGEVDTRLGALLQAGFRKDIRVGRDS